MSGKTVLIIEDNPEEREIYATVLQQGGYRVLEAAHAEAGLRLAREESPDVVVTDVLLPSISGLTLTHILKSSRLTRAIPIVAMSCYHENAGEILELGCHSFLPKPFEPMRLVDEVRRAAGGDDAPVSAMLERVGRRLRRLVTGIPVLSVDPPPFPVPTGPGPG